MEKKKLKNNFFIKFINNSLILWDYKSHKQYEIDLEYAREIITFGLDSNYNLPLNIHKTLNDLNLLESSESSPEDIDWNWDILSYIFHIGTKDLYDENSPPLSVDDFTNAYLEHSSEIIDKFNFKPLYSDNPISLPNFDERSFKGKAFYEVVSKRKTNRTFFNKEIELKTFSNFMYFVFGNFHHSDDELSKLGAIEYSTRKTSPSGGNIHPIEAFVLVHNVSGILPGVYYYNPDLHSLHSIDSKVPSYKDLSYILNDQYFCSNSSFSIFYICRFEKIWWKYPHSRSYKFSHVDAGAIAQTAQLAATALDMNFWQTGAFRDTMIDELLNLKMNEACLFFMSYGKGDGLAIPKEFIKSPNK
jgi:SagB-type dehydrogenase family enzyme